MGFRRQWRVRGLPGLNSRPGHHGHGYIAPPKKIIGEVTVRGTFGKLGALGGDLAGRGLLGALGRCGHLGVLGRCRPLGVLGRRGLRGRSGGEDAGVSRSTGVAAGWLTWAVNGGRLAWVANSGGFKVAADGGWLAFAENGGRHKGAADGGVVAFAANGGGF